jgi:hypothetical protein
VILRKTSHPDVINHLLLLNEICMKNTLDLNQFFQLFLACLDNDQILFNTSNGQSQNGADNFGLIKEEEQEEEEEEEMDVDIDDFLLKDEKKVEDEPIKLAVESKENNFTTRDTNNTKNTSNKTSEDRNSNSYRPTIDSNPHT